MTVYNINKAIGRASSGIEYAQSYRNSLLSGELEQTYLFLDYINTNYIEFTKKLGFKNNEVVWIYGYLAGQKNTVSTYTFSSFEITLDDSYSRKNEDEFVLYSSKTNSLSFRVWKLNENILDRVDELVDGQLTRVLHYSDRLTNVEHYSKGTLLSRVFYNPQGEVAYRQYYSNREISLTTISGKMLFGRNAFFQEFFKRLSWSQEDVIVLDRSLNIADAVFPQLNQAKVAVVIHAEHFNQKRSSLNRTSWNNYYEYVFSNSDRVDWFIVSTNKQADVLREQFKRMNKDSSNIFVIPVGYIDTLPSIEETNVKSSCRLMTASRIADEKHIDTLIHATVEAKKGLPNLEFYIYGEGKKRKNLQKLIDDLGASSYIHFMGHHDLEKEYKKYDGYLSGSTSEGFGLTILEALSYGLPIIGLDVPYGNQELVESGVNGFLIEPRSQKENAKHLSKGILSLFSPTFDLKRSIEFSQQKAKHYLAHEVKSKWMLLLSQHKEGLS